MPDVHTGTEGGRDEAAGNRDCAGGGSSPSASVDQMQREGAEGAACTQRGQTLRSGKDARRRGHLGGAESTSLSGGSWVG